MKRSRLKLTMTKFAVFISVFLSLFHTLADLSFAEAGNWVKCYEEATSLVKRGDLASAAVFYYRAQLASGWAGELRPSAFVGNGNDPGTFRAAVNTTLGQTINPWAFADSQNRLIPILDKLNREVEAIKSSEQLSQSVYSGLTSSPEEEKKSGSLDKYPFTIPPAERLDKFKVFANKWIIAGRAAAKR